MVTKSKRPSDGALDTKAQGPRKALLIRIAGFVGLSYLGGAFLVVDSGQSTLCLLAFAGCLLMAASAHISNRVDLVAHSFVTLSFVSLAVLISGTGSIHSPLMVWMPTVAVAALLLINVRYAIAWLLLILLHHLAQFMAAKYLLIPAEVGAASLSPTITLWVKLNLAIALMLALYWYEIKYRDKSARLAARTHALSQLQANLQQTRSQLDVFIRSLESQLRGPMHRMRLMAPIPQIELPGSAIAQDDGRVVTQASDRLLHLVQELGALTRLDSEASLGTPATLGVSVDAASGGALPSPGEDGAALRIMVVTRRASLAFEIQQTLHKGFGKCEFGIADRVETAIVQLEFGNFDLALIELEAPGIDGLGLTRRIRAHANAQVRGLTILGLADSTALAQRHTYLDAGMQWVLFRPWAPDTLLRVVRAQLS